MTSPQQPLVFVDLETTGATPANDRITEIGIVELSEQGVSEWSTLVNPETPIPPFIERLTGISNAMVADAPRFGDIAADVMARLKGRLFLAHNARFDYGFLRSEFKRAGLDFRADVLCTVKLSRKLFPQHHKHSLTALVERHNLPMQDRHRALSDARAIYEFWRMVHADLPAETIRDALDELLKMPVLPAGLDPSLLDDLPESPGAFVFHGENDTTLFVGRGGNIRRQVLSHFTQGRKSARDAQIAREIRRVSWVETAGELGALLTESRLVRSLRPMHNRHGGRVQEVCSWKMERGENGGMALRLVDADEPDFSAGADLYGLFTSHRKAQESLREIAAAHRLCLVQLQQEKRGRGACHAYAMQGCKGACIGKEATGQHDLRLITALAKMKVQDWPFAGPVGIRETPAWGGETEIHLVDRWRYLGSVKSEQEIVEKLGQPTAFDLDIYKILTRFFKQGSLDIVPLEARGNPAAQP